MTAIILLLVFYVLGGVVWFVVNVSRWDLARVREDYPGERQYHARRALSTPFWPIVGLLLLASLIRKLRAEGEPGDERTE